MPGPTAAIATVVCALILAAPVAWGQATVKPMQMKPIASVNGKDVYEAYCEGCHGADLKGHGPLASGLKAPPADLTTIALRNGGKFVPAAVEASINRWDRVARTSADIQRQQRAAQGDVDSAEAMPAFAMIFAKLYPQEATDRRIRMNNLVAYIKSKQVKEPPPADVPK